MKKTVQSNCEGTDQVTKRNKNRKRERIWNKNGIGQILPLFCEGLFWEMGNGSKEACAEEPL